MIDYKTFAGKLDANQDVLLQQKNVRDQAITFANGLATTDEIVEICETAVSAEKLFTVTVWYKHPVREPLTDISQLPEAQSADVLARSLHEQERREILNTMISEHLIRSDSK